MLRRLINRIDKIEGENIFVFQFIDSNGERLEKKMSIEDFLLLHPLVLEKEKRLEALALSNNLLLENKGILTDKITAQLDEIEKIKLEKRQLENKLEAIVNKVEGKAFDLFRRGEFKEALDLINTNKQQFNYFVDSRDGEVYKTVSLLNGQVWLAENLNYDATGSSLNPTINKTETKGRLYNWSSLEKSCPSGWRIPSDEDWKNLALWLNQGFYDVNKPIGDIHWTSAYDEVSRKLSIDLIGGYRDSQNKFIESGTDTIYWSNTEKNHLEAWCFEFMVWGEPNNLNGAVTRKYSNKSYGYYSRCIRGS